MTYSEPRARYAEILDSVTDEVITRAGHDPVDALDDDQSPEEAAHLLRSPENARRLLAAIGRLEGGGTSRDLVDPDEG